MSGRVVLVGGGPGDPGLITVAGMRALQEADVVVCDRLVPTECLDWVRSDAEVISVGKIPRGEFTPQERINEMLVDRAQAGKLVVRFKGGDSFIFGRGGEEWQACAAAGIEVNVIPGVSSSIAAPALAGIPLTHRGLTQGYTVVSGHVGPDDDRCQLDWSALARTGTTLVVMMGVQELPAITARLLSEGMDPAVPAAVVCRAGLPGMEAYRGTLATIADIAAHHGVCPPAVTVIGDVAALDLHGTASPTDED